jgi:hypothetical protein
MKRIAAFLLMVGLVLAGSSLYAKDERITPEENARRSSKAARQQQKMLKRANKKQRNAMNKATKKQRKEIKKANRGLHR